jgi:WD40 repeat protein
MIVLMLIGLGGLCWWLWPESKGDKEEAGKTDSPSGSTDSGGKSGGLVVPPPPPPVDWTKVKAARTILAGQKYPFALRITRDGSRIACASSDTLFVDQYALLTNRLWNASTGEKLLTQDKVGRPEAFSSDGNLLATSKRSRYEARTDLVVWNALDGSRLRGYDLKGHNAAFACSAEVNQAATYAPGAPIGSEKIRLWEAVTGKAGPDLAIGVPPLGLSLDGRGTRLLGWFLNSPSYKGGTYLGRVWEVATGKPLASIPCSGDRFQISPDGKVVANLNYRLHQLALYDAVTGESLSKTFGTDVTTGKSIAKPIEEVDTFRFSMDGKMLAIRRILGKGSTGDVLRIWDLEKWSEVYTLSLTDSRFFDIAFSPDGRWLATGTGTFQRSGKKSKWTPGTVKIWDVGTGKEVRTLEGHPGPVGIVAFSGDGRRLVSAGMDNDGTIKVWEE